jgi:hypothetical protein
MIKRAPPELPPDMRAEVILGEKERDNWVVISK